MKKTSSELVRIGWREWVALPDLEVPGVKAKVDTGARTSALHTANYDCFKDKDGQWQVRFQLHPIKDRDDCVVEGQTQVLTFRKSKIPVDTSKNAPLLRPAFNWGILNG
jgi:ribosomal protein S6--L-glutamate ligase